MAPAALWGALLLGLSFALDPASVCVDEAMSLIQVRAAAVTEETLQESGRKRNVASGSAQSKSLNVSHLAWLHVPKAGTSFVNTLVSWGCDQLDEDDIVDDSYMLPSGMYVPKFLATHKTQCENLLHVCGGHQPITDKSCNDWNAHKGNFVALFRDPEQRLISGFNHNLHDYQNKNASLQEYATALQGCTVRMLTGFKCGDADTGVNPTMQKHAIQRIHEGFAFVGLTEQWALSVCLFHAMFGGECHHREFANVRPGEMHTANLYSMDGLNGFRDNYDGAVYAKAKLIFYANLAKYHVNEDTCRTDICKAAPEAFA